MQEPRDHPDGTTSLPPPAAPHRVRVPVNIHRWERISFLHWPVPADEVARLLPTALEVLTWEGSAWVGVTPFFIRVRPPGVPVPPSVWAFPETNVRTYVRDRAGREGLWFLHMEVTAAWFVATLRAVGLPYTRRRMSVEEQHAGYRYRSRPRSDGAVGGHDIVVRPRAALWPPSGQGRDRFLTARWGAYHRRGPALLYTPVEHPPWPLHHAEVQACDVAGLFAAAELPGPVGPPVVHFSPGVTVKVGGPRLVR